MINLDVIIRDKTGWDLVDIWFVQYHHDRTMSVWYPSKETHLIKEGDCLPDPSLTLDRRTMQNFIKEAKGSFPASEQMHEHLKDAITVRDRMIALIEKRF